MAKNTASNPAVQAAKDIAAGEDGQGYVTLYNGVTVQLLPVPPAVLSDVYNRIKPPEPPLVTNPEYPTRDPEPNYDSPSYKRELEAFDQKRGMAVMDALVMFGVRLVYPMPEDDLWIKQLQFLHKKGDIDISQYDLEDPFEREFVYKKLVLCTGDIIAELNRISNIQAGEVDESAKSFRRHKKR